MLRLCLLSLLLASLLLTSCGQVFVSAFSHPGSSTVFIGTVSIVQIIRYAHQRRGWKWFYILWRPEQSISDRPAGVGYIYSRHSLRNYHPGEWNVSV
jgi:hypothetical protein